ncbi:hypothetical protein C2869_19480 [Saccharobesus litoralis]|uniref:Pyrrolo-quinoline quinone repeat domain-containing protein n=1 Tax=Saccharobesus litoralis TaxID=2172099 RepID=A0A2S0VWA6_9ALTE|nr:PQQ-binding-like beta-propeller repeat protein [Saccharobesus litoralis]AWB68452.1 hypothetical protein C2869_19480 [Saccharobesus litoralis]
MLKPQQFYVSTPKRFIKKASSLLAICIGLSACGGGGDDTAAPEQTTTINGKVIDGYISGALVYLDLNLDKQHSNNEPSATTNGQGQYSLSIPESLLSELKYKPIRAYIGAGAKDASRPELDFSQTPITLSAFPLATNSDLNTPLNVFVTPFTDKISQQIEGQLNNKGENDEASLSKLTTAIEQAKQQMVNDYQSQLAADGLSLDEQTLMANLFVDFADSLPQISTDISANIQAKAEKLTDTAIQEQDLRDLDNDGIANKDDTDDDGDGHADTLDAFPLDASEHQDTDQDGVGNNADVYPNDGSCFAEEEGDGSVCYSAWLADNHPTMSVVTDTLLYLTDANWDKVLRVDLATNRFISSVAIANPRNISYSAELKRLYINTQTQGLHYLADSANQTTEVNSSSNYQSIIAIGNYVIANDSYNSNKLYTIAADGEIVQTVSNFYYSASNMQWDPVKNRLYYFTHQLTYANVNLNTGAITPANINYNDIPWANTYIIHPDGKTIIFPNGNVYNTDDFTFVERKNINFSQAVFHNDQLITWNKYRNQVTLNRYNQDDQILQSSVFNSDLSLFAISGQNAPYFLSKKDGAFNLAQYVVNDDLDNDGVDNIADAFPNNASASLDSDLDGYPDSWNTNFERDPTSQLTLDAFPQDNLCWLASQGQNDICDYASAIDQFEPNLTASNGQDTIYFYNRRTATIYRWSKETQAYTNTLVPNQITPTSDITQLHYAKQQQRLYVSYSDGTVSYFVDGSYKEQLFKKFTYNIDIFYPVADYLVVQENGYYYDATIDVYNSNGSKASFIKKQSRIVDLAWDATSSRLYTVSRNPYSSGNILGYFPFNTDNGRLSSLVTNPNHENDDNVYSLTKITVADDGQHLIDNLGQIYTSDFSKKIKIVGPGDTIANQWADGNLFSLHQSTLEFNKHYLRVQRKSDLRNQNLLSKEGRGIAVVTLDGAIAAVSENNNQLSVRLLSTLDSDQDGIPAWWETLYGLDDSNAQDATNDDDEDGLTALQEFENRTFADKADSDDDGLNDYQEVNETNTLVRDSDTDNDGLKDGEEVNQHSTSPLLSDTDADGLDDAQEVNELQSNPLLADSDGDGLSDKFEFDNGLQINVSDADIDTDNDGLSNAQEVTYNTDVNLADTDGDGLSDGDEINSHSTDPLNFDSDSDKMADGFEVQYGLDPNTNTDANTDTDLDGYSNLFEYYLNSDPSDALSIPMATAWRSAHGDLRQSSFKPVSVDATNITQLWHIPLVSNNATQVVSDNGVAYTLSQSSQTTLTAHNELSGAQIWQQAYSSRYGYVTPIITPEQIIWRDSDYLRRLNRETGSLISRKDLSGSYSNQIVALDNGTVFSSTYSGIQAIDNQNSELWRSNEDIQGHMLVENGKLYTHNRDGLIILDSLTGTKLHSIQVPSDDSYWWLSVNGGPIKTFDNQLIAIVNNKLTSYNLNSMTIAWQKAPEQYSNWHHPVAAMGKLYVASDNHLIAINPENGNELWRWSASPSYRDIRSIVASLTHIFVSTDSAKTYAINIANQQVDWQVEHGGELSLSNSGILYINGSSTYAYNVGADSDGDGLNDLVEQNVLQTNPAAEDTDQDGLTDGYEFRYGLDPTKDDSALDPDADGLTNAEEFTNSTSPIVADTDNDGLTDSEEVNIHLTDPTLIDTDGDKMADGWEISNNFDANSNSDGSLDSDADGFNNAEEFFLGTNPNDASQTPNASNWAMNQGNAQHTGFIPMALNTTEFARRWQITLENSEQASNIAIANGKLFVSSGSYSSTKNLYAFNTIDGSLAWQTIANAGSYNYISPPATDEDHVYLYSGANLIQFQQNDGSQVYTTDLQLRSERFEAPTLFDSKIYVPTSNYTTAAFNSDGTEIWQTNGFDGEYSAVALDNDYVYTTKGSGLIAYDRASGAKAISIGYDTRHSRAATPVITQPKRVIAITDGTLRRFNIDTQSVDWSLTNNFQGQPAYAYGVIYANQDGILSAIDETSGQVLWSWEAPSGNLTSNIVVSRNLVFVQTYSTTYAIDINNHLSQWSYDSAGHLAINNDGAIYIVQGSQITAINIEGDSDNDGIPNWWENAHGLNKDDSSDAALDPDNDGLTNLEEFQQATDPTKSDTDGDGLTDGDEVNSHLSSPTLADSDHDGLNDYIEVTTSLTDPNLADSDGDFLSDNWEYLNGFDANLASDALEDKDNDGFTALDELTFRTDPEDADSAPLISGWEQYQGNAYHNGYVPLTLDTEGYTPLWNKRVDSQQGLNTIAVNGQYLAVTSSSYSDGDKISLLSAQTGNTLWNVNLGQRQQLSAPSFSGDLIIVSSESALYGYNQASGTQAFSTSLANYSSSVLNSAVFDNTIYTPNRYWNHGIYAHDNTGQENWYWQSSIMRNSIPAIDNDYVYSYAGNQLDLIDRATGITVQSIDDPRGNDYSHLISAPIPVSEQRVLVKNNSRLVMFDTATNQIAWQRHDDYNIQPSYAAGRIFAARGNQLDVISEYTGQLLWSWISQDNEYLTNNIIVTRNVVFVQTYNTTYAINLSTQQQIWSYAAAGSMALNNDGTLYIVTASNIYAFGTLNGDQDSDGLPDWWEQRHQLLIDSDDANEDADNDGLTNIQEYSAYTDPNASDTDQDGVSDGDEVNTHQSNPLLTDSDNDGLNDNQELTLGTNIIKADSDDDKFNDGAEVNVFNTDPLDANSVPDSLQDSFESDTLASMWQATDNSNADWFITDSDASDGSQSLRAGIINNSQQSGVQVTYNFSAGKLSFDVRVDSESCCDSLLIFLNDENIEGTSLQQWQSFSFDISEGEHTIKFVYRKDGSSSRGEDTAWIDNILFTPN